MTGGNFERCSPEQLSESALDGLGKSIRMIAAGNLDGGHVLSGLKAIFGTSDTSTIAAKLEGISDRDLGYSWGAYADAGFSVQ